jgi:tetratricopeptide (TPR) repeat protein
MTTEDAESSHASLCTSVYTFVPSVVKSLSMKSKFLLCAGGLLIATLIFVAASPEKRSDPTEAARLNNLGCAYMNQQLFEKALKNFEAAAALDPPLRVAKLNRGIALLSLGRVEPAKKLLDEAAKDDSKDPHVWYALGMLEKNSSNPEAAVEDFKRVIEIDDSDADTWYFLGTVYSQLKQFPQAIDAFEHALKLNPLHASAQFGLSRAYQQSGDSPHAREHLARFQYITQNKLGSAMSLAYGEQGKYSLAEESQAATVKVPPQIPVTFVDVTKEAGITSKPSVQPTNDGASFAGPGACFLDYDNDGNIDLLLPNNGTQGSMSLYHNLGNGKFEDVTKKAGLDGYGPAISCTAGDYDNDGFADLALSFGNRVLLVHDEKNGTFKDVTQLAGISIETVSTAASPPAERPEILGLTFVDYDHDGDLDLYLTRWTPEPPETLSEKEVSGTNIMWRNNGNGTFTDVTEDTGLRSLNSSTAAVGTDINNDRAIDIVTTRGGSFARTSSYPPLVFENPREGKFRQIFLKDTMPSFGVAGLDFDHDGWMDLAFTHFAGHGVTLWRNNHGKTFEEVPLPQYDWQRIWGIAAFDYDNDGWVDLAVVGERAIKKFGPEIFEIRLFRNLGPDGWKDVTTDVGLDKIQLKDPRAIITGDYDNNGATDLLITQNHGPAVLLKNEGGNKNNWLRLALKGLNDNKSAIGTKVEVFSDGIRQKYEIYGSNGYLGQNSPYLTVGLGQAKQADVVRMLWPGGVLQDEIEVTANKQQDFLELDRRGSSCPTLFVWDGNHYELVADVLGAGVVGHWVAPNEHNIPRPTEWVKVDRNMIRELTTNHVGAGALTRPAERISAAVASEARRPDEGVRAYVDRAAPRGVFSFRLMEPMEEVVYLDAVKLVAIDHPANEDVYPNEYFASNPPYPEFKVITSRNARPPAGAWDDKGRNLLPDLLAHKYVGNFDLLPFKGFARPHSLTLDLGEPYRGGPLRLLMHGEIEYFTATGMYAASQAGIEAMAPYVEAEAGTTRVGRTFLFGQGTTTNSSDRNVRATQFQAGGDASPSAALVAKRRNLDSPARECRGGDNCDSSPARDGTRSDNNVGPPQDGKWVKILNDTGFPAGLPRTITTDLTGKLPQGTTRIRITTNLQIYWDSILIDRSKQSDNFKLSPVPLVKADLDYHGYPRQIEDQPPGNVKYMYEQVSRTGPYARQAGEYTRYGDIRPLLSGFDDKLVVFGSGEEVALEFDPAKLPPLPKGWTRDYFFQANGYEKDMDFYAAEGSTVEPLPFRRMGSYPYPGKSFPSDAEHLNYMLMYNTRFVSGHEPQGYSYDYQPRGQR